MLKQLLKKKLATVIIEKHVAKLARTTDKKEFYATLDDTLRGLIEHSTGQNRSAVEVVRRAAKIGHPFVELARLLVQKRLSEVPLKKLVNTFFLPWVFTDKVKSEQLLQKEGFEAPWFFVVSPLKYCDLACPGCYANADRANVYLKMSTLDRIASEAEKIGVRFMTISGGEPFIYVDRTNDKTLLDFFQAHNDMYFQVYTNGTSLVDAELAEQELAGPASKGDKAAEAALERIRKAARRNKRLYGQENIAPLLAKIGNVAPAISQEGFADETDERRGQGMYLTICNARKNLTKHGVLHGFSITYTQGNADIVTSTEFMDSLVEQDVSFGWYFLYIPKGREPNVDIMATPEQRVKLRDFVWNIRGVKPVFIGDFWNDGPWVGGCIAGARKYFHIRAEGSVTPCVFADFSIGNIEDDFFAQGKTLKDVIQHPAFRFIRTKQLEVDNKCAPCCIIDNPEILREVVKKFNLAPALSGEEEILQGKTAQFLDVYSKQVRNLTQSFWDELKTGKQDTENVKISQVIANYAKRNKERVYFEDKTSSNKK